MKVTNIAKGPRGLNTKTGPVLVEPGQTVDVEFEDNELKAAKATDWFEFGAAAAKASEQHPLDHDDNGRKGGNVSAKKD